MYHVLYLSTLLLLKCSTDCSLLEIKVSGIKLHILKFLPIMLALCQHNTLAYYALYYAGIFDSGLSGMQYILLHCYCELQQQASPLKSIGNKFDMGL